MMALMATTAQHAAGAIIRQTRTVEPKAEVDLMVVTLMLVFCRLGALGTRRLRFDPIMGSHTPQHRDVVHATA